jgi:hypothetical protein
MKFILVLFKIEGIMLNNMKVVQAKAYDHLTSFLDGCNGACDNLAMGLKLIMTYKHFKCVNV